MSNLRIVSKDWDQITECSLSGIKEVVPRAGATLPVSRVAGVLDPDMFRVGIVVDKEDKEDAAVAETERWPNSVVKAVGSKYNEEADDVESGAFCLDVVPIIGSGLSPCGENSPSSGLLKSSPNLMSARPLALPRSLCFDPCAF